MNKVKDALDILKKAQEIDRELYFCLEDLERIPNERLKNQRGLESEKTHLNTLEAALKKLQLVQKEKDGELAQKEAQVKKLDGQLALVKTNKEYSVLQQEIASLKADNSLLEEEIIRILDEMEAAQEEVKKENNRLKQCQKDYEAKEQELSQNEKTFTERVAVLRKQREEAVGHLDPEVRSLYERIVEKKKGLALVKVHGEVCGACQMQLRPQLINEIQLGETLVLCENCSRILYFEE
jgi:hypothetical protein